MIQSMTILLHGFRVQFCTAHFSVGTAACIKSGEEIDRPIVGAPNVSFSQICCFMSKLERLIRLFMHDSSPKMAMPLSAKYLSVEIKARFRIDLFSPPIYKLRYEWAKCRRQCFKFLLGQSSYVLEVRCRSTSWEI